MKWKRGILFLISFVTLAVFAFSLPQPAYTASKKKLTREEIVEILKRNAELYKIEPSFINYIVDLVLHIQVIDKHIRKLCGLDADGRLRATILCDFPH